MVGAVIDKKERLQTESSDSTYCWRLPECGSRRWKYINWFFFFFRRKDEQNCDWNTLLTIKWKKQRFIKYNNSFSFKISCLKIIKTICSHRLHLNELYSWRCYLNFCSGILINICFFADFELLINLSEIYL